MKKNRKMKNEKKNRKKNNEKKNIYKHIHTYTYFINKLHKQFSFQEGKKSESQIHLHIFTKI